MSQQINLFNPAFEKQKHYLSARSIAQSLGAIVVVALALNWYGEQRIRTLEQEVALSKAALDVREARRAQVAVQFAPRVKDPAIAQALAQAEADKQALQDAEGFLAGGELGTTRGYAEYFRAFARSRVEGLWLTGIDLVGAGRQIGLQGKVTQPALVPRYIAALGKESILNGKSFAALEIGQQLAATPSAPAVAATAAAPATFLEFSLQSTPAQAGKNGAGQP